MPRLSTLIYLAVTLPFNGYMVYILTIRGPLPGTYEGWAEFLFAGAVGAVLVNLLLLLLYMLATEATAEVGNPATDAVPGYTTWRRAKGHPGRFYWEK